MKDIVGDNKVKTVAVKYINNLCWKMTGTVAIMALLVFSMRPVCAQSENLASNSKLEAEEYKVKAIYLYNFLLFTEWPKAEHSVASEHIERESIITIGILGKDPFGDSFSDVEGKVIKSKNKKLIIKRFGPYNNNPDLKQCDLLFIASSEKKNREKILKDLEDQPILTTADTKNFLNTGGMINLVKIRNKIRWEVNHAPVKQANLRLSSQLLRNAVKVVEIPKPSKRGDEGRKNTSGSKAVPSAEKTSRRRDQ